MTRIKNTYTFIEEILKISKNENYSVYYRGEPADYGKTSCQPGIFRTKSLIENEHNLFKEYITLNPDEFYNDKLTLDKLTRMQHYFLPTRLLDLTTNVLQALYFSCESNNSNDDSVVYIMIVPKNIIKYYDSDTVSVIANLAKREKFDSIKKYNNITEKEIDDFNKNQDIQFLLHNIKDEKPYFKDKIVPKHINSIICVKPLQNNKRIVRQQGMFLIFGNSKTNKFAPASLEDNGIKVEKIFINKAYKSKIIKELSIMGISKATVYPDLKDTADFLKEKYTK